MLIFKIYIITCFYPIACFNGAIKLKDCHTLNVTGTYPHHVVIGNMNSSENATFNLTISPDDRYLNISYNVSGVLGPVKQIELPSFHNCKLLNE